MSNLNAQQQKAVDLNDDKILCLAGAGTGKTHSMIARISRIVSEGVDPSSILVLTFTNAAAFEMKERYRKIHTKQRPPEFRTFHSFCYSLLVSDKDIRKKLGYNRIPIIADEGMLKRIQTSARMQCGIKLTNKQLDGKSKLTPNQMYELELYNKAVRKLLKKDNLITFDILCYDICALFVEDDPVIFDYKQRYSYIFVDEFQDTDPRQYEFIRSFKSAKLFVVGDALQAIYSFRGADSSIIKRLAEDEQWTTVKLFDNYRSTKQICDFANENSIYADDAYRIAISSNRDGDEVEVIDIFGCDYGEDIDANTFPYILEALENSSGNSAILCRTNKEVSYMINYLDSQGIAYSTGKKNTDAIHILKSSIDNAYMVDWLSTFLNADNYANYIRYMALEPDKDPAKLFVDKFGGTKAIGPRLSTIFNIRRIFKGNGLKVQKCADVLKELGIKDIMIDTEATTVSEVVEYLIDAIQQDNSSNLYVGTIHSSKGLEYDNVYLVGVEDRCFKLTNEENNNLYYVGITRAKSHLMVFYKTRCFKYGTGTKDMEVLPTRKKEAN